MRYKVSKRQADWALNKRRLAKEAKAELENKAEQHKPEPIPGFRRTGFSVGHMKPVTRPAQNLEEQALVALARQLKMQDIRLLKWGFRIRCMAPAGRRPFLRIGMFRLECTRLPMSLGKISIPADYTVFYEHTGGELCLAAKLSASETGRCLDGYADKNTFTGERKSQ